MCFGQVSGRVRLINVGINFQKYLLKQGVNEDEFKKIDQKIKETISEAAEFAIESSEPELSDLFKDIYLEH